MGGGRRASYPREVGRSSVPFLFSPPPPIPRRGCAVTDPPASDREGEDRAAGGRSTSPPGCNPPSRGRGAAEPLEELERHQMSTLGGEIGWEIAEALSSAPPPHPHTHHFPSPFPAATSPTRSILLGLQPSPVIWFCFCAAAAFFQTRKLDTWRISPAGEALGADSNNGFQQRSSGAPSPRHPQMTASTP